MTAEVTYTSGGVPTAANLNATESKTVAASNAAPSNAVEGRLWYDTNAPHPLIYAYDGSTWQPLPMGLIAKSNVTAMTTPIGSVTGEVTVNGTTITFDAEDGQRYAYRATVTLVGDTVGDFVTLKLQQNGVDVDVQHDVRIDRTAASKRCYFDYVDGPGAGSVTFRVRLNYSVGSGAVTIPGGTDVYVEHIGSSTL